MLHRIQCRVVNDPMTAAGCALRRSAHISPTISSESSKRRAPPRSRRRLIPTDKRLPSPSQWLPRWSLAAPVALSCSTRCSRERPHQGPNGQSGSTARIRTWISRLEDGCPHPLDRAERSRGMTSGERRSRSSCPGEHPSVSNRGRTPSGSLSVSVGWWRLNRRRRGGDRSRRRAARSTTVRARRASRAHAAAAAPGATRTPRPPPRARAAPRARPPS